MRLLRGSRIALKAVTIHRLRALLAMMVISVRERTRAIGVRRPRWIKPDSRPGRSIWLPDRSRA